MRLMACLLIAIILQGCVTNIKGEVCSVFSDCRTKEEKVEEFWLNHG